MCKSQSFLFSGPVFRQLSVMSSQSVGFVVCIYPYNQLYRQCSLVPRRRMSGARD
jgi:hypothetical protein